MRLGKVVNPTYKGMTELFSLNTNLPVFLTINPPLKTDLVDHTHSRPEEESFMIRSNKRLTTFPSRSGNASIIRGKYAAVNVLRSPMKSPSCSTDLIQFAGYRSESIL